MFNWANSVGLWLLVAKADSSESEDEASTSAKVFEALLDLWNQTSLMEWARFLLTCAGLILLLFLLRSAISKRLSHFADRTETNLDDFLANLIQKTRAFFIVFVSFYIASKFLTEKEVLSSAIDSCFVLVALLQVWFWGRESLEFSVSRLVERDKDLRDSEEAIRGTMPALMFVGKLVLFSLIILLALDNFGFDVTALIASLGVGGIAIALAVQSILGDLFASLSIVLDKPFKVGDFIVVGDMMGTVEKIGLKTTRVRSLGGEQLVFSNNDLLGSRIRNFKQMNERRIVFKFGVIYQTPAEQLKQIPEMVREIIEQTDDARFDRAHFASFGSSSLDFEVVYYVLKPDYLVYMNVQQNLNNRLFERFEKEKIEFAYPTQTLFLEKQAS